MARRLYRVISVYTVLYYAYCEFYAYHMQIHTILTCISPSPDVSPRLERKHPSSRPYTTYHTIHDIHPLTCARTPKLFFDTRDEVQRRRGTYATIHYPSTSLHPPSPVVVMLPIIPIPTTNHHTSPRSASQQQVTLSFPIPSPMRP